MTQQIDIPSAMSLFASLGVGVSAIWAIYRLGRTMLSKDFVDKSSFDSFVREHKEQAKAQRAEVEKLQNELHTLSTSTSEIGVHVQWIKATLERSPLTGEHRRPDGF